MRRAAGIVRPAMSDDFIAAFLPAPWMRQAACRESNPDLFFPHRGENVRAAKAVCAGCPVINECRDYSIVNDERVGIWGGLTERDRRHLRVVARRQAS